MPHIEESDGRIVRVRDVRRALHVVVHTEGAIGSHVDIWHKSIVEAV